MLDFQDIDRSQVALVGGKGAHLGELSRIEGIRVPAGYCVTTDAFRRVMACAPALEDQLDRLSQLSPDDRDSIAVLSAEIRSAIAGIPLPDDLAAAITGPLAGLGETAAYAVRSSATAEDLPTASFAGQQDTYLNVVGPAAILEHIRSCWASLFTERAVTYRLRNGFDHRKVHMAVVVQRMVSPDASGVLFTADPVTSNRKVTSVEAGFGLGEALVSGLVNADVYEVRDGEVVDKKIATKQLAIRAVPGGGTQQQEIEPELQQQPALTDAQVVQVAQLGRRIEAHFDRPQDIEWCLVDGDFQIVQSRPITTLFPVPPVDDQDNHVYLSVGHQQMMTDPMKPLGLSFWQMTTPRPMSEAGGRLFVDVTDRLASPATRDGLLKAMETSDPLMKDALQTVLDRGDFIPAPSGDAPDVPLPGNPPEPIEADPAIVDELLERGRTS
ncbi:PEP/pyruvate-binding domain-containing protein, partial [Saccharopolyspora sp. NPDC002686]|uniref:PEP/pyruvate-binding domain-containing protein n=1 Tax=Saccharopolyspora sp. NPDC002686 TaxID=3154541 RepID=UPI003318560C